MSTQDEQKKYDSPAPRREFLKKGLVSIAGLAAAGALSGGALSAEVAAEDLDDSLPKLAQPFKSQRILKSEATGEAPRQQQYVEMELIGNNDVRLVTKVYLKRTDLNDSYDVVTLSVAEFYRTSSDPKPEKTAVTTTSVSGIKGEVEGDYRLDTVTTTFSSPLGIRASGPQQVKVLLQDPASGMSDQEKLEFMLKKKGLA